MKKLALTSLLAFAAVSGAHAANILDGNPLYRPDKGRFYSITSLQSGFGEQHSFTQYGLGEEFGFGITDKISVIAKGSLSSDTYASGHASDLVFDNFGLGLNGRYVDMGGWKADLFGSVQQNYAPYSLSDMRGSIRTMTYDWTIGTRAGFVETGKFALSAVGQYTYVKDNVADNDDLGVTDFDMWQSRWLAGVEGQYILNNKWDLVGNVMYGNEGVTHLSGKVLGATTQPGRPETWSAKIGANYNLDETKFVGGYLTKVFKPDTDDSYGIGVLFGIDF